MTACPWCGAKNDAATGLTGAPVPAAGDVGICFSCAGLLVYTGNGLNVRRPSRREEHAAASSVVVAEAIRKVLLFRGRSS